MLLKGELIDAISSSNLRAAPRPSGRGGEAGIRCSGLPVAPLLPPVNIHISQHAGQVYHADLIHLDGTESCLHSEITCYARTVPAIIFLSLSAVMNLIKLSICAQTACNKPAAVPPAILDVQQINNPPNAIIAPSVSNKGARHDDQRRSDRAV